VVQEFEIYCFLCAETVNGGLPNTCLLIVKAIFLIITSLNITALKDLSTFHISVLITFNLFISLYCSLITSSFSVLVAFVALQYTFVEGSNYEPQLSRLSVKSESILCNVQLWNEGRTALNALRGGVLLN